MRVIRLPRDARTADCFDAFTFAESWRDKACYQV